MANLRVGDRAPSFSLKDRRGKTTSLKNIKSKFTVVYFYPKDNTSGCTIEAKNFSKNLTRLKKLGAQVIGISGGNAETKREFCKKNGLKVTLLSDPSFKTARNFKSFGQQSFMGRKYRGISRNTFILDKEKRIIKMFAKVNPTTHTDEVIRFLKSGSNSSSTYKMTASRRKNRRNISPKRRKRTTRRRISNSRRTSSKPKRISRATRRRSRRLSRRR